MIIESGKITYIMGNGHLFSLKLIFLKQSIFINFRIVTLGVIKILVNLMRTFLHKNFIY